MENGLRARAEAGRGNDGASSGDGVRDLGRIADRIEDRLTPRCPVWTAWVDRGSG